MKPDGSARLRIALYILMFVAASYAVVHIAFWSDEDSITNAPTRAENPGAPPSGPASERR